MLDSESSAALSFVLLLHPLPENSSENSSFFRSSRHCCAKQSGTNVDLPLPVAASTITTPKDSARIGVLFWQSKANEISGHTATVDGSEIQDSPDEVGSLSRHLQGFTYTS